MRGGAIPLLAWGSLLLILYIGNWIWDATGTNPWSTALAVLLIYGAGALLILRGGRRAVRRGPPPPDPDPHTIPQASTGAVLAAIGFAAIVFGFTFGSFVTYFGAGLLLIAIARLITERRAERRTLRGWEDR